MPILEAILSKYKVLKGNEATNEAIEELESAIGITLPDDYKGFLINYHGFEHSVGEEYVSLWDLDELMHQNKEYLILENLPNTIGIGSSGAGELIALERKDEREFRVVLTPLIDLSEEYNVHIGDSFTDFLQRLENGQEWFNETEK